jgi:hypothetical protein
MIDSNFSIFTDKDSIADVMHVPNPENGIKRINRVGTLMPGQDSHYGTLKLILVQIEITKYNFLFLEEAGAGGDYYNLNYSFLLPETTQLQTEFICFDQ